MTMDEIFEAVVSLAENDQSIPDTSVVSWTNMAINRINTAVEADIPLVSDLGLQSPQFDERYHEAIVLFCVAKYRESDSSYNDANYFMNQFIDMVKDMQRDMVIQPSIRKGEGYQQIVVPSDGTSIYPLDIPYGSYFSRVDVYHNDKPLTTLQYRVNLQNRTITVVGVQLVKDDKITIKYENSSELNNPPHQWWGSMEW